MTRKAIKPWLPALLLILPLLLPAQDSGQVQFKSVLILENGRIKPLDTFARNLLKQFSGRSTFSGQEASVWLARVLFTPGQTLHDRVFLINHSDVPTALGIAGQGRQRYSFLQVEPGLAKLRQLAMQVAQLDERSRSAVDNETWRLYVNCQIYIRLLSACDFAPAVEPGSREPAGDEAAVLAIVPPSEAGTEGWLSPAAFVAGPGREAAAAEVLLLQEAAQAFRSGQDREFSRALGAFNRSVQGRLANGAAGGQVSLEIFYNGLDPFFKAQLAYGLALLLLLLSLLVRGRLLPRLSLMLLLVGLLFHSSGLLARMVIMGRPPVTNLYETFVFVAWVCVVLGVALELAQRRALGVMTGGIAGLLFLLVAGRYSMEGDTMGMLAAVLDSNLWLATHVATISIGYAGCVIAGIIGHVQIVHRLLHPGPSPFRALAARSLYAVLAFGLVFTFIGTVMGGIWADQSWGRFWGWDPKENGALLIILWCAIVLHARLAGMIRELGMAAGAVVSLLTVVLAWFGVNLLGVGMHSYGFTSGIVRWLLAYIAVEIAFLAAALYLARSRPVPRGASRGAGAERT